MKKFIHGQPVRLISPTGRDAVGTLHLPDLEGWGRYTGSGYGVHTIRMPDGRLFRTEGRLARPEAG